MIEAIKHFAMAGSPPHYITALGVLGYAVLEWWLGRTKLVQSNSSLELAANLAKKALIDRIPLLGKLVKALATPTTLLLAIALAASGCATSATPKGATLAQKLHDDEAAIGQIELDVKTQCGPQFAPLGATASAIMSLAEGAAAASSGNIASAIGAAAAAFPILAADVKGMECVYRVVTSDYAKLKPHARRYTAVATLLGEVPICDNRADAFDRECRPIVDTNLPTFDR